MRAKTPMWLFKALGRLLRQRKKERLSVWDSDFPTIESLRRNPAAYIEWYRDKLERLDTTQLQQLYYGSWIPPEDEIAFRQKWRMERRVWEDLTGLPFHISFPRSLPPETLNHVPRNTFDAIDDSAGRPTYRRGT
ncbi:hypothetical protein Rctr85_019 [Virus Rctr85]|nr:hypothetical protein Rctr85_019 [Virus Rctr85]